MALLMPIRNESILSTNVLIRLKFCQHNALLPCLQDFSPACDLIDFISTSKTPLEHKHNTTVGLRMCKSMEQSLSMPKVMTTNIIYLKIAVTYIISISH